MLTGDRVNSESMFTNLIFGNQCDGTAFIVRCFMDIEKDGDSITMFVPDVTENLDPCGDDGDSRLTGS